jgi:hypothetical protein
MAAFELGLPTMAGPSTLTLKQLPHSVRILLQKRMRGRLPRRQDSKGTGMPTIALVDDDRNIPHVRLDDIGDGRVSRTDLQ